MANGVQAMKDIAYFVTKDIEDDGIAYALRKTWSYLRLKKPAWQVFSFIILI